MVNTFTKVPFTIKNVDEPDNKGYDCHQHGI